MIPAAKLIDTILNLAGLLLWLSWLLLSLDPMARAPAVTLAGTLKRADSGPKRWLFPCALLSLLALRAFAYWEIGPAIDWTPSLKLGTIAIAFRSDYLVLMLLYSALGFVVTLSVFYSCLLLLSVLNRSEGDAQALQKLVRLHLGLVERMPAAIKLLLPFLAGGLLWMALHPLLARLGVLPEVKSTAQLLEQAAIIGASTYLGWKYLIVAILLFHLLNSYIYLGEHHVWGFVSVSARHLMTPLRWLPLRVGRLDFAPVVGIAVVLLLTESITRLPGTEFYQRHLYKVMPF